MKIDFELLWVKLTGVVVLLTLASTPAWGQYNADRLRGKPLCSATRTTNCVPSTDAAGAYVPMVGTGSVTPAGVTGARICTISSSSATAYVGATSPAMSTYPAGVEVRFTANQTSGAAPTLNCGGGAMAIRDALASAAIPTGFLESGYVYTVRSNGTYWLMQEPAPGAAGQKFLSNVSVTTTCPTSGPQNVKCYEAKGDGKKTTGTCSGSTTFIAAQSVFSAADVGKTWYGRGFGNGGIDLTTTITGYTNTTTVTLGGTCYASTGTVVFGTNDTVNIQNAIDALQPMTRGSTLDFPAGIYVLTDTLTINDWGKAYRGNSKQTTLWQTAAKPVLHVIGKRNTSPPAPYGQDVAYTQNVQISGLFFYQPYSADVITIGGRPAADCSGALACGDADDSEIGSIDLFGNWIHGGTNGIRVFNGGAAIYGHNLFEGNGSAAVLCESCFHTKVQDNDFYDIGVILKVTKAAGLPTPYDLMVQGNYVYQAWGGLVSVADNSGSDITISGNRGRVLGRGASIADQSGIYLGAGVSGVLIANNSLRSCETTAAGDCGATGTKLKYAIDASTATSVRIADNDFATTFATAAYNLPAGAINANMDFWQQSTTGALVPIGSRSLGSDTARVVSMFIDNIYPSYQIIYGPGTRIDAEGDGELRIGNYAQTSRVKVSATPPASAATTCAVITISAAAGFVYVCGPTGSTRAAAVAW